MLVQVVFAVSITSDAAAAAAAGAILIELGNESWGGGGGQQLNCCFRPGTSQNPTTSKYRTEHNTEDNPNIYLDGGLTWSPKNQLLHRANK